MGIVSSTNYGLILQNPKDFYHEIHRISHFIKFNRNETQEEADGVDIDNLYL